MRNSYCNSQKKKLQCSPKNNLEPLFIAISWYQKSADAKKICGFMRII